jgi:hypothetical protein
MKDKPGKTYFYPNNPWNVPATPNFYFTPPKGVIVMKGVVEMKTIEIPWDKDTRFYECLNIENGIFGYGTASEVAIKINSTYKVVKTKAKTQKLYNEKFLIQEIQMDEFFEITKRFKREKEVYA